MSSLHTLYLTGHILDGRTHDDVSGALAQLTGLTPAQATSRLQGRESLLKRQLEAERVPRYLAALQRIGVAVRIEPPLESSADTASGPATDAPTDTSTAAAGSATTHLPASVPPLPPLADTPPETLSTVPSPALEIVGLDPVNTMTCPACQTEQPRRTLCLNCGADMPRMLAALEEEKHTDMLSPYAAPSARVDDVVTPETATPAVLAFSMRGRIGRLRYLAYTLPAMLPALAIGFVGGFIGAATHNMAIMTVGIVVGAIATWIMMWRLMVLRLHDLDLSGKWSLLSLLPIVMILTGSHLAGLIGIGVVYLVGGLYLLLRGGSPDENGYGAPPGPNTLWTVIGAILALAVFTFGQIKGQGNQRLWLNPVTNTQSQAEPPPGQE